MAAVRGVLKGNRGSVSRLGGMEGGVCATLNTWTKKIRIHLAGNGHAVVEVSDYTTGATLSMYELPANGGKLVPYARERWGTK